MSAPLVRVPKGGFMMTTLALSWGVRASPCSSCATLHCTRSICRAQDTKAEVGATPQFLQQLHETAPWGTLQRVHASLSAELPPDAVVDSPRCSSADVHSHSQVPAHVHCTAAWTGCRRCPEQLQACSGGGVRGQSDRCPNQAQCCSVRQFAMAQADVKPQEVLERLKEAHMSTSLYATVASPGSSNSWLHAMCLGLMPEQLCTCKAQPSLAVHHGCMLGSQGCTGPALDPAHLQVLKLQAVVQCQLQGITVNIHADDVTTAQDGGSDCKHALQQRCMVTAAGIPASMPCSIALVCAHSKQMNGQDSAQPDMHDYLLSV